MNLSDNLKKIRKDNNLSQEQLAEKLNVSRQSVSKWESGTAYPEMDKVLQLCQLFNLNIDDLLNQNISEVNEIKQSKNTINKYIDDFLDFITKTVDMFSSMKFKSKIKCIIEQIIIAFILFIVLLIIGAIGNEIIYCLLSSIGLYSIIYDILRSIYTLVSLFLGTALVLHIFKTRYLDYYVIVREGEDVLDSKVDDIETKIDTKQEISEQVNKEEVPLKNKKIYLEKKKEKIVIRDPKHAGYKLISGLLRCMLFIVKIMVAGIAIGFCFTLIGFVILLGLSFLFIKTGLLFLGGFLGVLAMAIVNLIILDLIYNFLINKKSKTKKLAIIFASSLIVFGIGIACFLIGLLKFDYVRDISDSKSVVTTIETIEMSEDILIRNDYMYEVNYRESDNNDIKVEIVHSSLYNPYISSYVKNEYFLNYETINEIETLRAYISDINNMKFVEYANMKVTIVTSLENIEKIKANIDNNDRKFRYSYVDTLNETIDKQQEKIEELQNELLELQQNENK